MEEKKRSSKQIFKGKVITVEHDEVETPAGKTAFREVVRHNGGVCILALDESDNVLLVRQYRYPYGEVILELPAGKLEPGEDPADCGLRELEEETGHTCKDYRPLGRVYPTPGYVDEILYLFLAKELTATQQQLDEDEFLTVESVPFDKAVDMCLDGTIVDAKSAVAILKYSELRRRGQG